MTKNSNLLKLTGTEIHISFTSYFEDVDEEFIEDKQNVSFEDVDSRMHHSRYLNTSTLKKSFILNNFEISDLVIEDFTGLAGTDLAHVDLSNFTDFSVTVGVRIYEANMVTIKFICNINGTYSSEEIVALINSLLDEDLKFRHYGERTTLKSLVTRYANLLSHSNYPGFDKWESYSIIIPDELIPHFDDPSQYYTKEWRRQLYLIAVRRIMNYTTLNLEKSEDFDEAINQTNIAFHNGEIAILNYHNSLIYINNSRHRSLYINVIDVIKSLSAFLHFYDVQTYQDWQALTEQPLTSKQVELIEERRIDLIKALQMYDMLTGVSSTRASIIIDTMVNNLRIDQLQGSIRQMLEDINAILNSRHQKEIREREASTLDELVSLQRSTEVLELILFGVYGVQMSMIVIQVWFGSIEDFTGAIGQPEALGIVSSAAITSILIGKVVSEVY